MAKRFHFDDEFDDNFEEEKKETIPKPENKYSDDTSKNDDEEIDLVFSNKNNGKNDGEVKFFHDISLEEDEFEENEEEEDMTKKKRKIKPWHIILIIIILIAALFFGYIFFLTNTDGPVYGNRCDGATAVNIDARNNTITTMKKKYSDIKDLTIEVVCKEIKVDIVFKDKTSKSTAKKIGEEVVKTLDTNVGLSKDDGKTYSQLFGYIKNEAQYDCLLYLVSEGSEDFPIYGTKHHSKDSFSYTYASVKDKDSKEKAEKTLEKK